MDGAASTNGDYYANLRFGSNSSHDTLGLCGQRFKLDKLLPRFESADSSNTHLRFGHILGSSIQQYFITGNIQKAYINAFMSWKQILDDDDEYTRKKKKTFWHILNACDHFVEHRTSKYSRYEVVDFGNGPACELGFSIDFGKGYFYRGYIDIVLVDWSRKKLLVLELKSTGGWPRESNYKYSGQGLGYVLVLDHIAKKLGLPLEASWTVEYPVYSTSEFDWQFFPFHKSRLERAKWIKNIVIKNEYIEQRIQDGGYFPQSINGCNAFGEICPHYGYCGEDDSIIMPNGPEPFVDKKYEFNFRIEDIIRQMLENS